MLKNTTGTYRYEPINVAFLYLYMIPLTEKASKLN